MQIITNLLANAAKYTPERGRIGLKLDVNRDQVAIVVEDSGVGMAADFIPQAFDIFAQAEQTSDRATGGLGLGLALVKSLAELHGGKVTCASAGPGKGSQFTVWLQKLEADEQSVDRRRSPRVNPTPVEALKIMVVDDNVDAASVLAMLLESAGHEVITAHRAGEALDRSRSVTPSVFVLDIGLPDFDGNELARRLRAQPETRNAMLIALTGYGLPEDRARTSAAGFDHHLVKPVDTEKLYRILHHVHAAKP